MKKAITLKNGARITVDLPSECPRCHCGILPEEHFAQRYTNRNHNELAYVVFRCPSCENLFSTEYYMDDLGRSLITIGSHPYTHNDAHFSKAIEELSPMFCKTYNEAACAERSGLSELVGMGYRKALEYLVKDFAIHDKPKENDKIAECNLGACIENYIDNKNIQKLAQKAAWLGNDEAHYMKRHEGIDGITKIKSFINAIVTFIDASMAVEEAEKIEKS